MCTADRPADRPRRDTAYIDAYHHRPHSGLAYRTPTEVARTWTDPAHLHTTAT